MFSIVEGYIVGGVDAHKQGPLGGHSIGCQGSTGGSSVPRGTDGAYRKAGRNGCWVSVCNRPSLAGNTSVLALVLEEGSLAAKESYRYQARRYVWKT